MTETGCEILTARLPESPLLHWEEGWAPRTAVSATAAAKGDSGTGGESNGTAKASADAADGMTAGDAPASSVPKTAS